MKKILKDGILNYLSSLTNIDKIGDNEYILGLPYFMSDGDGVEILVKKLLDGTFAISDDGETLNIHTTSWAAKLPNEISEEEFGRIEKRLGSFSLDRWSLNIYKENITEQALYKEIFDLTMLLVQITEEN